MTAITPTDSEYAAEAFYSENAYSCLLRQAGECVQVCVVACIHVSLLMRDDRIHAHICVGCEWRGAAL
jgi:hypothetical protein